MQTDNKHDYCFTTEVLNACTRNSIICDTRLYYCNVCTVVQKPMKGTLSAGFVIAIHVTGS